MSRETLHGWVRQGDVEAGARDGMSTQELSQHGVEDVAASTSEGDEGLVVLRALGSFAVVVAPGDGVAE
nr:hypothetical protein DA06_04355 [Georgenia sp. SUBG003]